jgi:hypothetical protein
MKGDSDSESLSDDGAPTLSKRAGKNRTKLGIRDVRNAEKKLDAAERLRNGTETPDRNKDSRVDKGESVQTRTPSGSSVGREGEGTHERGVIRDVHGGTRNSSASSTGREGEYTQERSLTRDARSGTGNASASRSSYELNARGSHEFDTRRAASTEPTRGIHTYQQRKMQGQAHSSIGTKEGFANSGNKHANSGGRAASAEATGGGTRKGSRISSLSRDGTPSVRSSSVDSRGGTFLPRI